jgi:hypothetical protein
MIDQYMRELGRGLNDLMAWARDNSSAVTALAALAAVVVTIIYTFFTLLLWAQTKRQATLTRQMFDASQRPWLSMQPTMAVEDPGALILGVDIKNHGAVAGVVAGFRVAITHGAKTLKNRESAEAGRLAIFPGWTEHMRVMVLHGQDAVGVAASAGPVIIDAILRYESYGRPYSTRLVAALRTSTRPDGQWLIADGQWAIERHEIT